MADAYPSFGFDPDGTARRRIPGLADATQPQTLGTPAPPVPGLKGAATAPLIPQPPALHDVGTVVAANRPSANPAAIPVPSGGPVMNPTLPPASVPSPIPTTPTPPIDYVGPHRVAGLPTPHADTTLVPEESQFGAFDTRPTPGDYALQPGGDLGISTRGLSAFERKQLELELRERTPEGIKISNRNDEITEGPPEKSPSRWRQVLVGLGQGALAGAAGGQGLGGAIGGAITGGVIGGVSPKMMQSLTRQQNIDRLRGDVTTDQEMQLKSATVSSTQAQALENQARARYYLGQGSGKDLATAMAIYRTMPRYKRGEDQAMDDYFDAAGFPAADKDKEGVAYEDYTDPRTGKVSRLTAEQAVSARHQDYALTTGGPQAKTGAATAAAAGRSAQDIQAEIDRMKGDAEQGRQAISQKDAAWKQLATKYMNDHDTDIKPPNYQEALAAVQGQDEHYTRGVKDAQGNYVPGTTYNDVVANTKAKEARLLDLQKELEGVQKEQRGGTAEAARGTDLTPAPPAPPPGKANTISKANLLKYAKRNGMTYGQALAQAQQLGREVR